MASDAFGSPTRDSPSASPAVRPPTWSQESVVEVSASAASSDLQNASSEKTRRESARTTLVVDSEEKGYAAFAADQRASGPPRLPCLASSSLHSIAPNSSHDEAEELCLNEAVERLCRTKAVEELCFEEESGKLSREEEIAFHRREEGREELGFQKDHADDREEDAVNLPTQLVPFHTPRFTSRRFRGADSESPDTWLGRTDSSREDALNAARVNHAAELHARSPAWTPRDAPETPVERTHESPVSNASSEQLSPPQRTEGIDLAGEREGNSTAISVECRSSRERNNAEGISTERCSREKSVGGRQWRKRGNSMTTARYVGTSKSDPGRSHSPRTVPQERTSEASASVTESSPAFSRGNPEGGRRIADQSQTEEGNAEGDVTRSRSEALSLNNRQEADTEERTNSLSVQVHEEDRRRSLSPGSSREDARARVQSKALSDSQTASKQKIMQTSRPLCASSETEAVGSLAKAGDPWVKRRDGGCRRIMGDGHKRERRAKEDEETEARKRDTRERKEDTEGRRSDVSRERQVSGERGERVDKAAEATGAEAETRRERKRRRLDPRRNHDHASHASESSEEDGSFHSADASFRSGVETLLSLLSRQRKQIRALTQQVHAMARVQQLQEGELATLRKRNEVILSLLSNGPFSMHAPKRKRPPLLACRRSGSGSGKWYCSEGYADSPLPTEKESCLMACFQPHTLSLHSPSLASDSRARASVGASVSAALHASWDSSEVRAPPSHCEASSISPARFQSTPVASSTLAPALSSSPSFSLHSSQPSSSSSSSSLQSSSATSFSSCLQSTSSSFSPSASSCLDPSDSPEALHATACRDSMCRKSVNPFQGCLGESGAFGGDEGEGAQRMREPSGQVSPLQTKEADASAATREENKENEAVCEGESDRRRCVFKPSLLHASGAQQRRPDTAKRRATEAPHAVHLPAPPGRTSRPADGACTVSLSPRLSSPSPCSHVSSFFSRGEQLRNASPVPRERSDGVHPRSPAGQEPRLPRRTSQDLCERRRSVTRERKAPSAGGEHGEAERESRGSKRDRDLRGCERTGGIRENCRWAGESCSADGNAICEAKRRKTEEGGDAARDRNREGQERGEDRGMGKVSGMEERTEKRACKSGAPCCRRSESDEAGKENSLCRHRGRTGEVREVECLSFVEKLSEPRGGQSAAAAFLSSLEKAREWGGAREAENENARIRPVAQEVHADEPKDAAKPQVTRHLEEENRQFRVSSRIRPQHRLGREAERDREEFVEEEELEKEERVEDGQMKSTLPAPHQRGESVTGAEAPGVRPVAEQERKRTAEIEGLGGDIRLWSVRAAPKRTAKDETFFRVSRSRFDVASSDKTSPDGELRNNKGVRGNRKDREGRGSLGSKGKSGDGRCEPRELPAAAAPRRGCSRKGAVRSSALLALRERQRRWESLPRVRLLAPERRVRLQMPGADCSQCARFYSMLQEDLAAEVSGRTKARGGENKEEDKEEKARDRGGNGQDEGEGQCPDFLGRTREDERGEGDSGKASGRAGSGRELGRLCLVQERRHGNVPVMSECRGFSESRVDSAKDLGASQGEPEESLSADVSLLSVRGSERETSREAGRWSEAASSAGDRKRVSGQDASRSSVPVTSDSSSSSTSRARFWLSGPRSHASAVGRGEATVEGEAGGGKETTQETSECRWCGDLPESSLSPVPALPREKRRPRELGRKGERKKAQDERRNREGRPTTADSDGRDETRQDRKREQTKQKGENSEGRRWQVCSSLNRELLGASRHRYFAPPPSTPKGFWDFTTFSSPVRSRETNGDLTEREERA
ncbi:hypothetical protein TGCAST_252280 [Toxoplasma gondii CAST]|uniref:DNA repair protein endonuclease SAE2/CtIP carboxy-terminal protein n=1 Tax=Toxoplasma gondii CAST TaxID=943122 RepID=A0A425HLJ6_TOXGO|nr:hypothetical protein TGCAST_252280 [Toxoplasma gondii CAST]